MTSPLQAGQRSGLVMQYAPSRVIDHRVPWSAQGRLPLERLCSLPATDTPVANSSRKANPIANTSQKCTWHQTHPEIDASFGYYLLPGAPKAHFRLCVLPRDESVDTWCIREWSVRWLSTRDRDKAHREVGLYERFQDRKEARKRATEKDSPHITRSAPA